MLRSAISLFVAFVSSATAQVGAKELLPQNAANESELQVTAAQGNVSRMRDSQPWAISSGERIPVAQAIVTGRDGYAHFTLSGGDSFDVFGNSNIIFRKNAAVTGDVLDVLSGRIRMHLAAGAGSRRQRIFSPAAVMTAYQPSTIGLSIDEDKVLRLDVMEGEIRVQHTRRPMNEPVIVRAVDAILIDPDRPISRQLDRGFLYRYSTRIWSAITLSRSTPSRDEKLKPQRLIARNLCQHVSF